MTTETSPGAVPTSDVAAPSRLAHRVQAVPPSGIRKFFDVIATMPDVISLGVGEPDFTTPRQIVEAGVESLREGRTHYTSNFGTLELRRVLAAHLERRYGVAYDPVGELLITVGASEAVAVAMAAIIDPGDEVILHEPSYVAYLPAILFNGGTPVLVATDRQASFELDPAAVEAAITPRTKVIFLGYPCNPTGAVLPESTLRAIADIAARHDLLVVSDEIYDRLVYGDHRKGFRIVDSRDRLANVDIVEACECDDLTDTGGLSNGSLESFENEQLFYACLLRRAINLGDDHFLIF